MTLVTIVIISDSTMMLKKSAIVLFNSLTLFKNVMELSVIIYNFCSSDGRVNYHHRFRIFKINYNLLSWSKFVTKHH